jgi:hypothetical protein
MQAICGHLWPNSIGCHFCIHKQEFFGFPAMVNDTQSFSQYKDKAHNLSTESIQRVIGSETYQPKLVQNWVDSIGQDIVNKLRVSE